MQSYLEQRQALLRFDAVPDPRDPRGQRWRLGALLSSALVSLSLLARSLRRAEQLTDDLAGSRLLRKLGIRRRVPDSTLGDALAIVAPQHMLEQLHRQVLTEHRRKALEPTRLPVRVLAIDGKVQSVHAAPLTPFYCQQQNAEGEPDRYVYRVLNATLISSNAAVCIHQKPIPAWTNEMGYFEEFFDELRSAYARADLFDIVTSDAGVLSREHCRKLDEIGLGYVVALKDNNPELEREARRVLGPIAARQRPVAEDNGWEHDSSRGCIKRQLCTGGARSAPGPETVSAASDGPPPSWRRGPVGSTCDSCGWCACWSFAPRTNGSKCSKSGSTRPTCPPLMPSTGRTSSRSCGPIGASRTSYTARSTSSFGKTTQAGYAAATA
ncbi:MAG: hypothetical protein NTZ61_04900 [Proteobacteria bacterium]|nr:hypothetical protein [Pseudomonadota bacterium]